MKRKVIIAGVILLCLVALGFFFLAQSNPNAPKFIPAAPDFKLGPAPRISYHFLDPRPFEGGVMWVSVVRNKKFQWYLFDIDQKKVLGELVNGWPESGKAGHAKVILNSPNASVKQQLAKMVETVTRGKVKLSRNWIESFQILDLDKNTTKELGSVSHLQGTGSSWVSSPAFRRAFIRPTAGSDVFVCDLEAGSMEKVSLSGITSGWWDDIHLLFTTTTHDLALFDVVTEQTSPLLRADEIETFLKESNVSTNVTRDRLKPFAMWDGKNYQFYFTDTHNRWLATNSILAKIEKSSGKLKMISPHFKFEWSDHFDPSGRYYLYSGRDKKNGDKIGAVFVRDLATDTTRTLVEDCNNGQFSLPHWYKDTVIYIRSNVLWQITLTETNATQLFPPLEK